MSLWSWNYRDCWHQTYPPIDTSEKDLYFVHANHKTWTSCIVISCHWPPCVAIRQFAHLLSSFEVITVSPTIFYSNFYVQLLTYVTKTNIYMQMLTYLIPVPESRFMWSHNQSNLTRRFLEREMSHGQTSAFYHFDQKIIIFKNEKRYPLAREKGVWEKKLNCTICENHLLHWRFRLLDLMLCSEFLCLKALGHLSSTPKKWTYTQFTFHRKVSPNDTISVTTF